MTNFNGIAADLGSHAPQLQNATTFRDVVNDSNFGIFLMSLICAVVWIIYAIFYHSRLIGIIFTKIANRFVKKGQIKLGSLSLSFLSGKIMFREFSYVAEDCTFRVQDGWIIFRWWSTYNPKQIQDSSQYDPRLSVLLNGFEYHLYNRSEVYMRLASLFNLDSCFRSSATFNDEDDENQRGGNAVETTKNPIVGTWRDLIPTIKIEILSGRVIYGNHLVPYTLVIAIEESQMTYTTKPAGLTYDLFMHVLNCKAENFKVVLSHSPKCTSLKEEPPRTMGEGFCIVASNKVEFYYYMDEPGLVPEDEARSHAHPPKWGIDIKCGKGTDFSYGPWADRQRDLLYKLFYPQDYATMKPTVLPKFNEKRQIRSFDLMLSTQHEATIDILFCKDHETNAVHMNIGAGSYLEITLPWFVGPKGYVTEVRGQLLHLEASTSLQFRELVQSESLQFNLKMEYPLRWNDHQQWNLEITGCKATAHLIFAHKWFFQAMINDWSTRARPDILNFVPYTMKINFTLKEFEIITITNDYNWIDCSSQQVENNMLAACGEVFELSFDVPFYEFLPETILFKFWIQVEGGELRFLIPDVSTSFASVQSLVRNAKIQNRDGSTTFNLTPKQSESKGEKFEPQKPALWEKCCFNNGWINGWIVPICAVSVSYTYHPVPPLGPKPQADVTTPEKEKILTSPLRFPEDRTHVDDKPRSSVSSDFDPTSLTPDKVDVECEVAPSTMYLYGSLLKAFINLKENIFGDYQAFVDMEKMRSGLNFKPSPTAGTSSDKCDSREYRPLEVTVSATLYDIRGHLLKTCSQSDPPCPTICVERFGFEMDKKFTETTLQVFISPVSLFVHDEVSRANFGDRHLSNGYLMLSGLQIRGHAMFSNRGRRLDQETLEYAWLVEVLLGKLSGRLTAPHVENIFSSLECFLVTVLDEENGLRSPNLYSECHHGSDQFNCPSFKDKLKLAQGCESGIYSKDQTLTPRKSSPRSKEVLKNKGYSRDDFAAPKSINMCPTSEDLKYKMVRLSIDAIDIYLVESGTAISLWISPLRFAFCNLHSSVTREGFTLLIPNVQIRNFVMVNPSFTKGFQSSNLSMMQSSDDTISGSWASRQYDKLNSLGRAGVDHIPVASSAPQSPASTSTHSWSYLWLEAGVVALGPLCVEIGVKKDITFVQDGTLQNSFLMLHDLKTKRLWFLWNIKSENTGFDNIFDIADGLKGSSNKSKAEASGGDSAANQPRTERQHFSKERALKKEKKCGCIGGCCFFGKNKGGKRFFWPTKKDWKDGTNVAFFKVNKAGEDFGFGQSILKPSVLIFDTHPYNTEEISLLDIRGHERTSKTPLVFKPSLLADVSHTSSSAKSNRSEKSNIGNKARRFSQPLNPPTLRRQTRISEGAPGFRISENITALDSTYSPHLTVPISSSSGSHFANEPGLGPKAFSSSSDTTIMKSKERKLCKEDSNSFDDSCMYSAKEELEKEDRREVTIESCEGEELADAMIMADKIGNRRSWRTSVDSLDSLSDISTSTLSVQEECMVNLQMHLNKPITESSLLMPCYMSHLTQFKCDNWRATCPLNFSEPLGVGPFTKMHDGKLVYAGFKYSPCFESVEDGFTTLAMVGTGDDVNAKFSSSPGTSPHSLVFDEWKSKNEEEENDSEEYPDYYSIDQEFYSTMHSDSENLLKNCTNQCVSIIVRTKNDINIMISPMLLEALQKFVEAMMPSLCRLHPLTFINHLHNQCISRVERCNLLKKEKSMLLTSMQCVRQDGSDGNKEPNIGTTFSKDASPVHASLFEQFNVQTIQGSVSINKVNVTLLQASVVEEVISFSALDNIRDLMCVSLVAVALEETSFNFVFKEQWKRSIQVLQRPTILPKTQKKRKSKTLSNDSIASELVFIENSEKQSELISFHVNIHRIHAQLRRLKNDSSILKEAVITAIPNQHSKVLFRFSKLRNGTGSQSFWGTVEEENKNSRAPSESSTVKGENSESCNVPLKCPDEKLGFIMFECGFEGIIVKGFKNFESPNKADSKDENDTLSVTLCNELPELRNVMSASSGIASKTVPESLSTRSNANGDDDSFNSNYLDKRSMRDSTSNDWENTLRYEPESVSKRPQPNTGSVSCVIQFRVMWYNFAAPPQVPITRKIDYTRMDWNLVSTASTAINSWLHPIDQLTVSIVTLIKGHAKRTTGLLASLMAEALEVQGIHQPSRSKYNKLNPLAKTLQDDPSCQLCVVLQRFIRQTTMTKVEANVTASQLPQLSMLRQGVIVLSRQWKNVLYTPLLLEHNLKNKRSKNFNVTFTLPHSEEETGASDPDISVEETTDERATLLDVDRAATISLPSIRSNKRSRTESEGSTFSASSITGHGNKALPSQPLLSSTRVSDVCPFVVDNSISMIQGTGNRIRRVPSENSNVGTYSFVSSVDERARVPTSAQQKHRSKIIKQVKAWTETNEAYHDKAKMETLMSERSHEESLLLGTHSKFPQHPSLLLLDAHVIFKPLLTSLGLMPKQIMGSSFDHLGSHLSLRASIHLFKIDIVESEDKAGPRVSSRHQKNFNTFPVTAQAPAFLCEDISLEGDFKKDSALSRDAIHKKSVIYLSRNYWRRQEKSAIIFSLNAKYIAQQVNMPLLRLLHQITTMIQNVRETQLELREQRPYEKQTSINPFQQQSYSSNSDIPDRLTPKNNSESKILEKDVPESSVPNTTGANRKIVSLPLPVGSLSRKGSASRSQSFAQRFKAVRGQKVLSDSGLRSPSASQTPTSVREPISSNMHTSDSKPLDVQDENGTATRNCWKNIYSLLDLYATRPETKTIIDNRAVAVSDANDGDHHKISRVPSWKSEPKDVVDDMEKGADATTSHHQIGANSSLERNRDHANDIPRVNVFGVARIQKTRLLASLSGLKLEAEIKNIQATSSYKKKLKPLIVDKSFTGHIGSTNIMLLEGVAPNQQVVVKVAISKSSALYSGSSKRMKSRDSGILNIGPVVIDIPQHPVVLHGMMTRSSKQLSSTLQEFRVNRVPSRISRGTTLDEIDISAHPIQAQQFAIQESIREEVKKTPDDNFIQPLVMQFTILVQSLSITAALLPSLQAQYKMENVKSCGLTGIKAKFKITLPVHSLSFTTKFTMAEFNLPTEASISLPEINVSGEYTHAEYTHETSQKHALAKAPAKNLGYLEASVHISAFQHCLSTDLLNHLVFIQKVFMKEVNEVVMKMSGGDKPVPLWDEGSGSNAARIFYFNTSVVLKSIQVTATTPTNTAVRLETGDLKFVICNSAKKKHHSDHRDSPSEYLTSNHKVVIDGCVNINLSLGQLIRNALFEEADAEYQQYAFFKTEIGLRNALSDDSRGDGSEKDVLLITLTRPLIYLQPIAVDKAILVWLNYKNAYDYWNVQRTSLSSEVPAAMQLKSSTTADRPQGRGAINEHLSTLFVQITIDDMGISIPLNSPVVGWSGRGETETRGAVVVTLENTSISACSSGSLVSKGRFNQLCFRFTDDMVSMDDWKPNLRDSSVMNFCLVSEGTYEVCSMTASQQQNAADNAKWFLNVKWQMEGVDMHIDVNIGKQLSALGHTLTTLAAFEEEEFDEFEANSDEIVENSDVTDGPGNAEAINRASSQESFSNRMRNYGENVGDSFGPRQKKNLLEMQEKAHLISELNNRGAPQSQIEQERKKLQELEQQAFKEAFKDFRRDWIKKLRRQSSKTSNIKEKFGINASKAMQSRSKSFAVSTPDSERHFPPSRQSSIDSSRGYGNEEYEGILVERHEECNEDIFRNRSEEQVNCELSSASSSHMVPQEPNVDLELDVKVFINLGKCVLHTKPREDEYHCNITQQILENSRTRYRSERLGSLHDGQYMSSPTAGRKSRGSNLSSIRNKSPFGLSSSNNDITVFHIPGLDVKIHYDSHVKYDDAETESSSMSFLRPKHQRTDSGSSTGAGVSFQGSRKCGTKRASLFAWTTLHSVPEETIISPHILDFLEQTLEPIQMPLEHSKHLINSYSAKAESSGGVSYASFPVDVIVYFHMQPSTFRFSCQPTSRVECMLKLPSLKIVFSSKRASEENGQFPKPSYVRIKSSRNLEAMNVKEKDSQQQLAVGGISVTGCLSDFSLFIFHPYGAAKKQGQSEWYPLSDNERKDSVSMNVEFVKFHLSRCRKLHVTLEKSKEYFDRPDNSQNGSESHQAAIRFCTIVDIGSASFRYDMRRLTEILAFPKAWYRRSIVRRLFLGDLYSPSVLDDHKDKVSRSKWEGHLIHERDDKQRRNSTSSVRSGEHSERMRLDLEDGRRRGVHGPRSLMRRKSSDYGKQNSGVSTWETLVLFNVTFTKLNVQMNMGNVMGNVSWLIKDAKSEGRLSIGSCGHKNLYVGVGLDSSFIDAKSGIVAGTFELTHLNLFARGNEDAGVEPHHNIGIKLFGLEIRLDFMGTSILMGRISDLSVVFKDEWQIMNRLKPIHPASILATNRPAMIYIHGEVKWDQLQIMISKSTTVDILKMNCKLDEFFSQQFKSSKYVFSTLQAQEEFSDIQKYSKAKSRKNQQEDLLPSNGAHWRKVLRKVSSLCLSSLDVPLPGSGTVLSGSMDLHGQNISLSCFHGVNFKAKSWALFSLREPSISFSTEAQETTSKIDGEDGIHVVQNLNFSLGQEHSSTISSVQHESMAMVCRITRNVMFPPQFRTLQEWFHYSFSSSEIDDVGRFPSLEKERERMEREKVELGSSGDRRGPTRLHDPNHNREIIFALPSMELYFKTEQLHTAQLLESKGKKPVVVCTFVTEFSDHIFVTVDAEGFFFLHDLITSYVKEKEKHVSAQLAAGRNQSPCLRLEESDAELGLGTSDSYSKFTSRNQSKEENQNATLSHSKDLLSSLNKEIKTDDHHSQSNLPSTLTLPTHPTFDITRDIRDYNCKTWQLEPTVRLLSWAGKSIEPYGVDYILQKLGFHHARITIPKWMQRGFCDPLDHILSIFVFNLVDLAQKENEMGPNVESKNEEK